MWCYLDAGQIFGGISSVQAVCVCVFFFNDMFELFLMGAHNGNINLSGCAITKDWHGLFPAG